MKFIHLITAFVFGSFIWVQFNDPDLLKWTLIYLPMVLIGLAAFFGKLNFRAPLIYLVFLLGYIILHLGDLQDWRYASYPNMMLIEQEFNVEPIREFFGVCLTFIVSLIYYLGFKKRINQ